MTCIAVLKDSRGKAYMAGDRASTHGDSLVITLERPKIAVINDMLIGCAGDGHICDYLVEVFTFPVREEGVPALTYVYDSLIPALRERFEDQNLEVHMLLVIDGIALRLTVTNDDATADVCSFPYAIGSGMGYALASLATTEGTGMRAADRLKLALQVTAKLCPGCDDNIDIIKELK